MSPGQQVRRIVDALLYEGYILFPYRPTSAKNRQRWTFGGVYPKVYSHATGGAEPWYIQTQCLLEGGDDTQVAVCVRFLHPLARDVGELPDALSEWPQTREPEFKRVPSLALGDTLLHSWQEATEREVTLPDCRLDDLLRQSVSLPFVFQGWHESVPLKDDANRFCGVLVRTQATVQGRVELSAEIVGRRVYRLTVRVENDTQMNPSSVTDREHASLYSLASTHTILGANNGQFVSLIDPPSEVADAAAACVNQGAYPVLVGAPGSRDTLLASPIILYDYPQVAPESAGDLYDATEIDEILSLNILAMTDAEKREMAAADPRAAALLARTEALGAEDFIRLHGTFRDRRPLETDRGDSSDATSLGPHLAYDRNNGSPLKVGERVRLHPRTGGDIMDLVLDGKTAVIEAIERDFEDRLHVAVALDDDPGREWGLQRMPGHRFFFSPDEIESVDSARGWESSS
jgi:hypothetical protein